MITATKHPSERVQKLDLRAHQNSQILDYFFLTIPIILQHSPAAMDMIINSILLIGYVDIYSGYTFH